MTIEEVARFSLGWLALVGWAIAAFSFFERLRPRHHHRPPPRLIACAAVLLAVNAALAQVLVHVAGVRGGRVVLAWLAVEVVHYALHRAMHGIPWLWRFHRLHHREAPLCWTTTWLEHPVDAALFALTGVAAAALVGGGLPTYGGYVVARRVWAIVLHANIAWPPTMLDAIIATPRFHARHHREREGPANFAATLPVLDRLFGTLAIDPA